MSENETPQEETPPEETPPEETPQAEAPSPPPPPPPAAPAAGSGGEAPGNRNLMVVLSYLWILALIPLLIEKGDKEVQWHAKHGLVLTGTELLLQVLFNAIAATGIGCIFAIFIPFVFLGFAVVRLVCIIKGLGGERFMLPGVSQYADKF